MAEKRIYLFLKVMEVRCNQHCTSGLVNELYQMCSSAASTLVAVTVRALSFTLSVFYLCLILVLFTTECYVMFHNNCFVGTVDMHKGGKLIPLLTEAKAIATKSS